MKKLSLVSLIILIIAVKSPAAGKSEVSFAAPDGFSLKGTFYSAESRALGFFSCTSATPIIKSMISSEQC